MQSNKILIILVFVLVINIVNADWEWNSERDITGVYETMNNMSPGNNGFNNYKLNHTWRPFKENMGLNSTIVFQNKGYYYSGICVDVETAYDFGTTVVHWEYFKGTEGSSHEFYDSKNWEKLTIISDKSNNLTKTGCIEWNVDMVRWKTARLYGNLARGGFFVRARLLNYSRINNEGNITGTATTITDYGYTATGLYNDISKLITYANGGNGDLDCKEDFTIDVVNKSYNCMTNGNMFIEGMVTIAKGDIVSVGNRTHKAYLDILSGGILQVGEYSQDQDFSYSGASLIYHPADITSTGGVKGWYGTLRLYDSTFGRGGGGITSPAFYGNIHFIDSKIVSEGVMGQTLYLTSNANGTIKNTKFAGEYLYLYSPDVAFEDFRFIYSLRGFYDRQLYRTLLTSGSYVKPYYVNMRNEFLKIDAVQGATIDLINPEYIDKSMIAVEQSTLNYDEGSKVIYSVNITLIDINGNPIQNGIIKASSDCIPEALLSSPTHNNEYRSLGTFGETGGNKYVAFETTQGRQNPNLPVGQRLWSNGEISVITSKGFYDYVDDNQAGTIIDHSAFVYKTGIYLIEESYTSNPQGYFVDKFNNTLWVVTYLKSKQYIDAGNRPLMEFNCTAHNITISAEGYNNLTFVYNITHPIDWVITLMNYTDGAGGITTPIQTKTRSYEWIRT